MQPDVPGLPDAATAAALMRDGRLSVEAVATRFLDRARERDPAVRGWAFLDRAQVVAQARALDTRAIRGPLHGVPVAVKDVIATADMPTQQGSTLYEGCRPGVDAGCVSSLRAAGALILGKTDTTEFAATTRGNRARHPLDPARTPGGSSSGSAAVVADGQALIGLGTQTAGSVIRPASFCGVTAMKFTWGAVTREGLKMLAPSLDTLGAFTRSAADLALLADAFGLEDRVPAEPFRLEGARIAVCRSPVWDRAEPATRDALARAEGLLAAAGARVEPLELPAPFAALPDHHGTVMTGEARASFLSEWQAAGATLSDDIAAMAANRAGIGRDRLLAALDAAAACRPVFDALAADFDAVLTPSAPGEAPVGTVTGVATFNALWTLLHVPVVNMPGFTGPAGMPVGLSLVAPRYRDRQLIAVAEAVGPLLASLGTV